VSKFVVSGQSPFEMLLQLHASQYSIQVCLHLQDHGLACARAGDWVEAATLLEAAAKALEAIVYNEKRYLEPEADQVGQQESLPLAAAGIM
jgi:hypothetical protein